MKVVAYVLAAVLGFFGLAFLVGSFGRIHYLVVGVILLATAGTLIWLAMQQTKHVTTTVVQKIDLSGDVNVQELTCRSCGGTLSQESVAVRAGAVFVNCPYCGASYQLEEEPKW